ncbi:hypothetical protein [Pseudoprimorskyibacter insulae]|uniref:hypothetical protein n=1 Tax=Pseudoprimorskyibacter insulae TaxID=1695997 RepID=UPI0015E84459|nr:hypothetical protein [Pseudoprimorskyibacter insulae]
MGFLKNGRRIANGHKRALQRFDPVLRRVAKLIFTDQGNYSVAYGMIQTTDVFQTPLIHGPSQLLAETFKAFCCGGF